MEKNYNVSQKQFEPKPSSTAKVATKLNIASKKFIDQGLTMDSYISEIRKEYDHRIRNGQPLCDKYVRLGCNVTTGITTGICDFRSYLKCNKRTLEWRRKEAKANQKKLGTMMTDEELEGVEYFIDRCISLIDKYLVKEII